MGNEHPPGSNARDAQACFKHAASSFLLFHACLHFQIQEEREEMEDAGIGMMSGTGVTFAYDAQVLGIFMLIPS